MTLDSIVMLHIFEKQNTVFEYIIAASICDIFLTSLFC